ncbi:MAG: replicative DNA helicase [Verrucomicrobiales bacterium]|nr:replicative DNA helicase [Verrucomicrobiales bacterium]
MPAPTKSASPSNSGSGESGGKVAHHGPSLRGNNQGPKAADDILRSLPVSADTERAALSCMLKDPNDIIGRSVEKMIPDFFYVPSHKVIYETLLDLFRNRPGGEIDLITLNSILTDRGLLEKAGGYGALAELLNDVPTTAFFDQYVEILKEKYVLRQVIVGCTESIAKAYEDPEDVTGLLDGVEARVLAIRDQAEKNQGPLDMRSQVIEVIKTIEKMYYDRSGPTTGLSTGFTELDGMTNGLHGGEMIVIAARPSMGKTSFVMNVVENVALDRDNPRAAAVFSLEMSSEQLVQRLLCSLARVEMQKLRGGFLSQQTDFPRLMDAAARLANSQIYIDDTPGLTIMELRAKARRMKKSFDIQLIAIDYLQLLKAPGLGRNDGRQVEIAEISRGIKSLAKELNIPIIVLAQLNRQPDARGGGKPKMSDLRESGAIEQDADLVGLLIRPEVYAENSEEKEEMEGEAQLIIAKQRNGPTGEVDMAFIKKYMRFENKSRQSDS